MTDARFGTVAAQPFNAQRTKSTQKVWHWTDFFRARIPKPRKHKTIDEQRADFYEMKRIKQGYIQ